MDKIKRYNNGLTLIVSEGGAISTSFAIMVGTGSINEEDNNNGISHYIEHMNFKGTDKYSSYDITNILDNCGANFNAYTSNETTCYYAHTIKDSLETSFSVMSNAVFCSTYLDEEATKEKKVIIEEINMSEDNPDEVCFDLSSVAFFGNDGYGRSILGSAKNVESFTKKDVLDYLDKFYTAENTVVVFSGNVTLEEGDKLVEKYVLPYVRERKTAQIPKHNVENKKQFLAKSKDVEQTHLCLSFPSVSYVSEDKIKSEMAVSILGGSMSSRLFRKIREELGLAYSVYAFASRYKDVGTINIYAGVNQDKAKYGFDAIIELIKEVNENGITKEEFLKVKNQLKSSTIFTTEKPASKAQILAKYYLMTGKLYDFDARIKDIDNVTVNDVIKYIKEFDPSNMSTAVVGRKVKPLKI